jgi:hypothetical protein
MPTRYIAKWADIAKLNQNGASRITPYCHPCLKQNVGPCLWGRDGLRVILTVRVLGSQVGNFIWSE